MTTDPHIAAVLADQVDVRKKSVGMVAGLLSPEGRHVAAHGVMSAGGQTPVDGDTAFEVASISKIFTGLLLVDMARKGEVRLDDPVDALLPPGMTAPAWRGRRLTLIDLATHTSGLPSMPPDAPDLGDPRLADYSVDHLLRSFCGYTLTRPIGTFEYGNWDMSIAGHLLARRAGLDFETLVEQRITRPLGMTGTAIARTAGLRLSSNHSADLAIVPRMVLGALAPAGGFVSTATDMLTLASALLELTPSPLAGLLDAMTATRRAMHPSFARIIKDNWRMMLKMVFARPKGMKPAERYFTGVEAALVWFVFKKGDAELLVHDGGAPNCSATLAIDRRSRTAAIAISNTGINIHDVGRHLIWNDYPLSRRRTEIGLPPAVLDRYVGDYQAPNNPLLRITRPDGRLRIAFPVVGDLVLRAENDHEFFVPEFDFEIRFAPEGPVRALVFQPGRGQPSLPVPRLHDR